MAGKGFLLLLIGWLSMVTVQAENRKVLFDKDWHFRKGAVAGAEKPAYDDSAWRILDLPHDWSIEPVEKEKGVETIGPFSKNSAGGPATGQTVGGEGWYRKSFVLAPEDAGKRIELYFEGVYNQAEVWVNGEKAGYNVYGYSSFRCDITPYCQPAGKRNVVAVRVVNEGKNSRWYTGSGIYRHVWLLKTNQIRLDAWETAIATENLHEGKAEISIATRVISGVDEQMPVQVEARILSKDGMPVAQSVNALRLPAADSTLVRFNLDVPSPLCWSPESPDLYTAQISVLDKGKTIDKLEIPFGIRTIEFSVEKGFLLNGKPMKLYGGCIHHDNGLLGAASYDRAEERKVALLKQNGFNAVRCSHNPPSEGFLDACDRLGMLVIDEAFDQWAVAKNPQDYHLYFKEWCVKDIQAMVRRDRNHPSIIMWSIGNEIRERITDDGLAIAKRLKEAIEACDRTRPVTAGVNKHWDKEHKYMLSLEKAFRHLDVSGYNYMWRFYEKDHEEYPSRIMYGSESVAMELAPNWEKVEKYPYVIGDFVWTALDYLGESGIGNALEVEPEENVAQFMGWPWYNGWCGDIDLCGVKKPQSYYRDIVWRLRDIYMAVEQPIAGNKRSKVSFWGWPNENFCWTYPGMEGEEMTVNVYSRSPKVRLYLNGELIGEEATSDTYKAAFKVPYRQGTLKAVCWDGIREGREVKLETTSEPAGIRLIPDKKVLTADGQDLVYVLVELTDAAGNVVLDSERTMRYALEGNGCIAAAGNGAPNDMESFRSEQPKFFKGRAMVIVKSGYEAGALKLKITSEGLPSAVLEMQVK